MSFVVSVSMSVSVSVSMSCGVVWNQPLIPPTPSLPRIGQGFSTGMTPEAKETVEKYGILYKGPMETPKGSGVKSINVTARKVWSVRCLWRWWSMLLMMVLDLGSPIISRISLAYAAYPATTPPTHAHTHTTQTFANKRVFQSLPGVDTIFSRAKIPIDLV